ncbi:uncharacterized protein DUF3363, partial [Acidomonas methanolica]
PSRNGACFISSVPPKQHNQRGQFLRYLTPSKVPNLSTTDIDATGDGSMGSVVELRAFDDRKGHRRVALAVRFDLSIEDQVTARGATWLDRQAVARDPVALGQVGFGADVRAAMERRAEHLIEQGLAERQAQGISPCAQSDRQTQGPRGPRGRRAAGQRDRPDIQPVGIGGVCHGHLSSAHGAGLGSLCDDRRRASVPTCALDALVGKAAWAARVRGCARRRWD